MYSIGEVIFGELSASNSAGFRGLSLIGEKRVKLLQLVRDGKQLPDGLFLIASHYGSGWKRIDPSEINWETSGIKPSNPAA